MNRSLKIFMAFALGGGIGTFVALQLNAWFWWLGLLVGGLVGYISYEPFAVLSASYQAYNEIYQQRQSIPAFLVFCLVWAINSLPLFGTLYLGIFCDLDKSYRGPLAITIIFFVLCIACTYGYATEKFSGEPHKKMQDLRKMLPIFNLINIYIIAPVQLFAIVAKGVAHFGWRVFILIHSELRLLCMLDAAIGAGIGYWFGSVLIGAIAGGVFGTFNYLVISVWWLKLVPTSK